MIYLLIGPPGCGKSTWALENKNKYDLILSSDEYRKNLLGDVNDQTQNYRIFKELNNDLVEAVKQGKSICLDATNISRKDRKKFFKLIEGLNVDVTAVAFFKDDLTLYERNATRDKPVPNEVLDRYIKNYQRPTFDEGFKKIVEIY